MQENVKGKQWKIITLQLLAARGSSGLI